MNEVNLVWAIAVIVVFAAGFAFAIGVALRQAWREWHHSGLRRLE